METEMEYPGRSYSLLEECTSPNDNHMSQTYDEQDEVEEQILSLYKVFSQKWTRDKNNENPILQRDKHSVFLRRGLSQLSDAYEALDASQPWLCYWILHAMNILDLKLSLEEINEASRLLSACQHESEGGFGGGPKQLPHLAATYAAINAFVSLGSTEAFELINRRSLSNFIMSMKVSDGSFRMHRGGEVDVRAVYCAVVVAKLTNLDIPNLFDGTAEWVVKCQTYEGGFGGFPGMEAHGGYTFCAVASLILLKQEALMDSGRLMRWLSFRQLPLEGGFAGRTNKLVDGCYSFWQGASFAVLGQSNIFYLTEDGHWIFNQIALQEYILICCQHPLGGLIDKPGKQRDYYHTCYTLSGLSISQHSLGPTIKLGSSRNLLRPIHPVFNLTLDVVSKARKYFYPNDDAEGILVLELDHEPME